MTGDTQVICLGSEAKYFCKWGWTQHRVICPGDGKEMLMPSGERRQARRNSPLPTTFCAAL
jgi:hypothetical protein